MSLDPEVRRGGNLPFGMVAAQWMCDPRYSTNARTLYSILVTYADTQARNTRKGKPYRKELAAQMGVSESTVDRTLVEMEVAGMVTIERREDPKNPGNNDVSVYHLHDASLMWQGNGTWTDPLGSGVKAADVAKKVIESRRAEKREQGIQRRGGVPKGIRPQAVKAAREAGQHPPQTDPPTEGGGSTGAARGSSTDAGRVAAPTLPNIQSPVQTPSPEPSFTDGRQASAGSRGSRSGGSAASGKTKPDPLTREEKRQYDAVVAVLPPALAGLVPKNAPRDLKQAVLDALAADSPASRTPQQLVDFRLMPKWDKHYSSRGQAGALLRPVGVLVAMLRRDAECQDDRCDERINVDTGEPCRLCALRGVDRRADCKNGRAVPAPQADTAGRPAPRTAPADGIPRSTCNGTACGGVPIMLVGPAVEDGLCRECRAQQAPTREVLPAVGGGAAPNDEYRVVRARTGGQRIR